MFTDYKETKLNKSFETVTQCLEWIQKELREGENIPDRFFDFYAEIKPYMYDTCGGTNYVVQISWKQFK